MSWLIAPGFFSNASVIRALVVGGVVSVSSGIVGIFAVLRNQSFSGEALGDIGATGGSAAYLVNLSPLWGFIGASIAASWLIEGIGRKGSHRREIETGVVLGAGLGVASLLLFLDATRTSTSGVPIEVLFGSLFVVAPSIVPAICAVGSGVLVCTFVIARPLLLSTLNRDLASARGGRVRLVDTLYLFLVALTVSLAAVSLGAILSTALLIAPAAIALKIAHRPATAALCACAGALAATWLGILLAYDSYAWPPSDRGWPVSFCIVALLLSSYALSSAWSARTKRRRLVSSATRGDEARL